MQHCVEVCEYFFFLLACTAQYVAPFLVREVPLLQGLVTGLSSPDPGKHRDDNDDESKNE
jgi:hypothetical protein